MASPGEREHYSNNYNKPAQQQTEVECPCDNATGRNVELATVESEKKTQAGRIQHCHVLRVGGNSAKDIRSSSAAVNYVWNLIWHLISDLIVCKKKMCTILLNWNWKQTSQQSFYAAQVNSIEHKIIMIYYIFCAQASGLS